LALIVVEIQFGSKVFEETKGIKTQR